MEHLFCRQRFTDFAEYREHLRAWDTEALQLSPGPLTIDYDSFDAGHLIVLRLKFDRAAIFRSAQKGWASFIVDTSPKRWCGIDVPPGSFRMNAPRRETNVITHEPWGSISVTVRADTLADWGSPLAELAGRDPAPESSILDGDQGAVAAFCAWVDTLFSDSMNSLTSDDDETWRAAICEGVKHHFLEMRGHRPRPLTTPTSAVHRVARYDLALAGLRAIHRQTDHRMTVEDLGRELGVGARALEYAFQVVVGVSPSQYILAERLNQARHDLRLGPLTGSSVTTIAFDHQFENLGRFSRQYTRLFGERPSDTLRSARTAFHQA
jgi:AraC-like DNA-binding protein